MADYLKIGTTSTSTKAIRPLDLSPLTSEVDRGENEAMPYTEGRIASRGWLDEINATIEWKINGFWSPAGTVLSDFSDGLDDNVEYYRALFRDDTDSAGRKEITLYTGNRVLEGLMQCRRWDPVRTGPATKTVLTRLVVAAGRLVVPTP